MQRRRRAKPYSYIYTHVGKQANSLGKYMTTRRGDENRKTFNKKAHTTETFFN